MELATDAGDAYQAVYALRHAAVMLVQRERPNDALKAIQLGGVRLLDAPRRDGYQGDHPDPLGGGTADLAPAAGRRTGDPPRQQLRRARPASPDGCIMDEHHRDLERCHHRQAA